MTAVEAGLRHLSGDKVSLRLIDVSDAEYVHGLRTDPKYNAHLSAVSGGAEAQRAWIAAYKGREARGEEYYFIIERAADRVACGTVRLYDIEDGSFCWGSWILDHNKPFKAALESALLIYRAGFDILGLSSSHFDVMRDNIHTLSFHRRFGAIETGSDETNIYFRYPRSEFERNRPRLAALL